MLLFGQPEGHLESICCGVISIYQMVLIGTHDTMSKICLVFVLLVGRCDSMGNIRAYQYFPELKVV